METAQCKRILDLIVYLTCNGQLTTQQYADMLGVTRRNVYNYLKLLSDYGFRVVRNGSRYHLDQRSPFFKQLKENIPLTDTEAEYLCQTLSEADPKDTMASILRTKLARHFGLNDIMMSQTLSERVNSNKAVLRNAIKKERVVKICNYSSPHSHTVTDRFVEPYMFLNNDRDIRCHEICRHQNKTFKLSRMEKVELMDMPWTNKAQHKQLYTDIFMFSGEERYHVRLLLGQLSHNIMVEEYPLSEPSITLASDGIHWILDIEVASFMGIGRFVMGLYDDIKVLGDEQFKTYINEKVALIKKSIQ